MYALQVYACPLKEKGLLLDLLLRMELVAERPWLLQKETLSPEPGFLRIVVLVVLVVLGLHCIEAPRPIECGRVPKTSFLSWLRSGPLPKLLLLLATYLLRSGVGSQKAR